jgi:peptidoglycan lytic transglycosylase
VIFRTTGRAVPVLALLTFLGAQPARPAAQAPSANLRALSAQAESRRGWVKLLRFAQKQKDPEQRGLAFFALGYREFDADSNAYAVKNFQIAAETGFSFEDFAEFYLASAAAENHQPEIVLKALADFSQRFPKSTLREDALELYARTLMGAGQPGTALQALAANSRVRQNAELSLLLAAAYRQAGRVQDAFRTYQDIYYAFPTSDEAGTAKKALGELSSQPGTKAPPVPIEIQTARAEKLYNASDYKDALDEYEGLLSAHPESNFQDRWTLGRARCLFRLRRVTAALDQLQQAFAGNPAMDAERLSLLVGIYARQDDPDSLDLIIEQLAKLYPGSPAYASALDAAGDYFVRQGDWKRAAKYYQPLATLFPNSEWGLEANWRVAWNDYLQKDFTAARAAFEDHLKRYPGSWHSAGALYWLARMAEDHGAGGAARKLYQSLVREFGQSYYAALADRRLQDLADHRSGFDSDGAGDWTLVSQVADRLPEVDSPLSPCLPAQSNAEMRRFQTLRALSLDDLAEQYLRAVVSEAPDRTELWLALGRFEASQGDFGPALMDAVRAVNHYSDFGFNQLPKVVWDLLYPRAYWNLVHREARARGLDPYLVMGLIRQESAFNPRAVSVANARGLMQVLPQTVTRYRRHRRAVARRLMTPAYNVREGTNVLRKLSAAFDGDPELALAAYHAGQTRVSAWQTRYAFRDPAEFLETIPIPATRVYVERVIRDAAVYRKLLTGTAGFADCRSPGARKPGPQSAQD